jgi:hypothetical protein
MSAGGGSDGASAGDGGPLRELRHAFGPAGHADAVQVVTLEARVAALRSVEPRAAADAAAPQATASAAMR